MSSPRPPPSGRTAFRSDSNSSTLTPPGPATLGQDALELANKKGYSMIDAYDIGEAPEFNMFYYLSGYYMLVYGCMCWQGDQGYNACAITPHAAQMSGIIARLRVQLQSFVMMLLPMAAVMVMNLEKYSDTAADTEATLARVYPNTTDGFSHLRSQQIVPVTTLKLSIQAGTIIVRAYVESFHVLGCAVQDPADRDPRCLRRRDAWLLHLDPHHLPPHLGVDLHPGRLHPAPRHPTEEQGGALHLAKALHPAGAASLLNHPC